MLVIPDACLRDAEQALLIANSPEFLVGRLVGLITDCSDFDTASELDQLIDLAKFSQAQDWTFNDRAKAYLTLVALLKSGGTISKGLSRMMSDRLEWTNRIVELFASKYPDANDFNGLQFDSLVVTSASSNTNITIG